MREGQFMTGEGQTVSGEGRREVMREAELLLKIHVQCGEAVLVEGHTKDILMIPFSGKAEGPYFTGRILGEGMDVRRRGKTGKGFSPPDMCWRVRTLRDKNAVYL